MIQRGLLQLDANTWKHSKETLIPKLTAKVKDKESFNVYYELDDGTVLIPRYLGYQTKVEKNNIALLDSHLIKELRAFQIEPVNQLIEKLRNVNGVTLIAPCGTGKSVCALAAAVKVAKTIVILVDQINIAEQWLTRILEFTLGYTVKVYGGDYCSNTSPFTNVITDDINIKIIIAQSLIRQQWINNPIKCDLLIVDEAHVFSAPVFSKSITNIDFKMSLALTATPDRKDGLRWVFASILGTECVNITITALIPTVYFYHLPFIDISSDDFYMWFCKKIIRTTWKHACKDCYLFDKFPNCGGYNLSSELEDVFPDEKNPPRLNFMAIMKILSEDEQYFNWLNLVIAKLLYKKRNVLVFSHLRKHLQKLYSYGVKNFGKDKCGLYLGTRTKADKDLKNTAMFKQITYCTYAVAGKALDVPHKDTAIFSTPKSDIRQVKGRIERVLANKADPVIIDPVFPHIKILKYMSLARQKIYKKTGCTIKYAKYDGS